MTSRIVQRKQVRGPLGLLRCLTVRELVRTSARRLLSGIGGAFLLASILFTSLFVVVEAEHDCSGEGCPICLQLQVCLKGLQPTGLLPETGFEKPSIGGVFLDGAGALDHRAPAITLQSLYVRLDE